MFLRSLTLRGFKSFADKTVLDLERGVTVVVGPNGSGKSNLVDAVAWVLGAQGARALRGAKMDDVIFAGTAERPALGRAEVALTIDNSAGVLPIEFSEVTITRTLFRTGESEYQLNGVPCRLLDVQELLSDSGIGRQQHVIVGQGQLDTVLNARPEDRRAIIEEAAGILKFRRRRERAERRLEATEASLVRLQDLLREVRRQLTPLQRQADAARRHDGLVAELAALRIHLAGHEIAGLEARAVRLRDQGAGLATREREIGTGLRALDVAVLDAEATLTTAGHGDLADALARVETLRERAAGLGALVGEKRRGNERELAAVADVGVFETLVADVAGLRSELDEVDDESAGLAAALEAAEAAEATVSAEQSGLGEVGPAEATGALERARGERLRRGAELERAEAELARSTVRTEAARTRIARLDGERVALAEERERSEVAGVEAADGVGAAASALDAAETAHAAAEDAWRSTEADVRGWSVRAETLAQALDAARAQSGADALVGVAGVLGPLAEHLVVSAGAEAAVAAVLGDTLGAVVVSPPASARDVLNRLAARGGGGLVLPLRGDDRPLPFSAPPGTRPLRDLVDCRIPSVAAALDRLLAGAVLATGDWRDALEVALARPDLTVVTGAGDRLGGGTPWRLGGDATAATRHALDAARRAGDAAAADCSRYATTRADTEATLAAARRMLDEARTTSASVAAAHAAVVQALARVEGELVERQAEAAALQAEADVLAARVSSVREVADALVAELPELERRAADERARTEDGARRREELRLQSVAATSHRRGLELRAAQVSERRDVLLRRLADVELRLARDPQRRDEAEAHRRRLAARGERYEHVGLRLEDLVARVDGLLERVRAARRAEVARAEDAVHRLEALRGERRGAEQELLEVRTRVQRVEVEEAETRLRWETAVERLRAEHGVEPAVALDAPAPTVPEGTTLAGRARDLDRELRLMGPINPLALEEHDALVARLQFLEEQLDDVKASRRELTRVIRAVDHEIVTVFAAAFADVAEHFERLFSTLFPGGAGKLLLTDPENLLDTGIEMEARPSGKNVRRLSLLSGGERSLTALAFLFAVFRARPSPFYLLDEVEAALDDVNLHRFLDLVHEFRDEAQLLIVSHQKRTMEAADCLYGVSMPPGGSSRVVSQRVNDDLPVG